MFRNCSFVGSPRQTGRFGFTTSQSQKLTLRSRNRPGSLAIYTREWDLMAVQTMHTSKTFWLSVSISPATRRSGRLLAKEDLFTMGPRWNDFLIFVAAQLQRTPAFFDRMSKLMEPTAQESLARMAKHDPKFRDRVRQSALARGITNEQIEQQLQRAASGGIRVKPTKDFVVSMSLALVYGIFEDLRQMTWQIATLADSDPDLILGDHPVLPVVPPGEGVRLRHPAIHVKLPLTRRVAAIGNWNLQTTYATFHKGQADQINAETMRHAKRFLFASHRSEELLAKARKLHGTGPKVSVHRIKKGKKLLIVHEDR